MARNPKRRSQHSNHAGSLPPSQCAVFALEQRRKQRSDKVWLVVLGLVVAGPLIYHTSSKPYLRNLYATREDCLADYSDAECSRSSSLHGSSSNLAERVVKRYHGPWYQEGSQIRTNDDPGPGRSRELSATADSSSVRGSVPRTGVEPGVMRGGFGRTGSIRAGRSSFGG